MVKLAFSTLGCPAWDFQKLLEEARRMGYTAVEVRGIGGVMRSEEIPAFFPENVRQTAEALAAYGVTVIGLGTSAAFHDSSAYEDALAEGKRAVDICRRMGIPFIRVFGDQIRDPAQREEIINRAARGIGALCGYARGTDVRVLLEIHGSFNTLETVGPLLEALRHDLHFGILWDIGHSDEAYGENWQDFYELIRPYIQHIHIKDCHRGSGRLCLPGEGDLPIGEIVEQLLRDGYEGYFSLEWEKKWVPELEEPEIAFPAYRTFMEKLAPGL